MAADALWVGLLGPFEVRVGAAPAGPGGARRRGLLAVLAAEPNVVHPVATIIERLWGQEPPASAVNVVQTYVSAWRKVLGGSTGPLSTVGTGYRLTLEPAQCDLLAFRAAAEEARSQHGRQALELWRSALDLWRGPALADLADLASHREVAGGLEAERARALERWAEAALGLGQDPDEVVARLREAQQLDPLRESTTVLLMRAHAAAGRPAAALRVYDAVRRLLDQELGTIPGPAMQEVHRRLLRGDPALSPPPPSRSATPDLGDGSRSSTPADRFFGRGRELGEVAELLDDGRFVTLTGPGGSGKTRLALEVLGRRRAAARPGWFVELAPVRDSALAPSAVAATLGLGVAAGTDPADMLVERLSDASGLLVLDNAEHLPELPAFVRRLHRSCRDLQLLVTSRQPLQVEGEQQYGVPVLPVPTSVEPIEVADQPSVQLLADRVRAQDPTFTVEDGNAADVARIVQHLDGLPLAIEIVAPWVRLHGPAALADRLADRPLDLRGRRRDTPLRHRSLRETIAWSHELVTERERWVFRRLAVFPATFGLEAAAAVCSQEEGWSVEEVLLDLVDRNLVQALPPVSGQPRFRLLFVVREFALEQLAGDPDRESVLDRMATWYAEWAARLAVHSEGPDSPEWLATAVAEADNVRAAIDHWVRPGHEDELLQLVVDAMTLWFEAGHEQEGEDRLRRAIDGARADAPARAIALTYWAWLRATRDRPGAAAAATEALAIAAATGDVPVEAFALQTLGDCLLDPVEAEAASRRALDACDRARDVTIRYGPTAPDAVRCGASASIASAWTYRSLPEALAWQREALRRAELEGDRRITAVNCARLAHLHLIDRDTAGAADLLGRARALVSSRVSARWEDIVALADALLARHEGRTADAETILRDTGNAAFAAGRVLHTLLAGVALADLLLDTGRAPEAAAVLDRIAGAGRLSDPTHVARLDVRRARLLHEQGRAEVARDLLDAMAPLVARIDGMSPERSLWLIEVARLDAEAGDPEGAASRLAELRAGLVASGADLPPWEQARVEELGQLP